MKNSWSGLVRTSGGYRGWVVRGIGGTLTLQVRSSELEALVLHPVLLTSPVEHQGTSIFQRHLLCPLLSSGYRQLFSHKPTSRLSGRPLEDARGIKMTGSRSPGNQGRKPVSPEGCRTH